MSDAVVIVGGGQAGYQIAASLRTEGFAGPVFLIGDEPHPPYQRPPLSKAFVLGKQDQARLLLRPESYYAGHQIELLAGESVIAIERSTCKVRLKSGRELSYGKLVLALGARNRRLPIPGAELDGVCYLRTLGEAVDLKQRLEQAQNVAVIGGGFVGLEVAASARSLGKNVTVIEALPRVMARAVGGLISDFMRAAHLERGTEILSSAQVAEIRGSGGKVRELVLSTGRTIPADLVVIGVGILPHTDLAREAGLPVDNGIAVDEFLRTADENVFAIGDCAQYPSVFSGSRVRLESVQNAVDQGVSVAKTIAGKAAPYAAVPWFWSDQFEIRLQMAGLAEGHDRQVVRGDPRSGKFSVFHFRAGKLCSVDSINRPADHLAARKLLASRAALSPEQAADESFNLKTL
jgi:3-phenylpropionate/trans-cinnamate dioxygenase ferredoxin reductase component